MRWVADARDEQATRLVRKGIVAELASNAAAGADLFAVELIAGELLSNLARYTPGPFRAQLERDRAGRALLVLHSAGHEFRPLIKTPRSDAQAESGRGLGIVRALGGELRVDAPDGEGCRITVALPVRLVGA